MVPAARQSDAGHVVSKSIAIVGPMPLRAFAPFYVRLLRDRAAIRLQVRREARAWLTRCAERLARPI